MAKPLATWQQYVGWSAGYISLVIAGLIFA